MIERRGKDSSIFSLKSNSWQDFDSSIRNVRDMCDTLSSHMEISRSCILCGSKSIHATKMMTVYGINYIRCGNCGHIYTSSRPSEHALNDFYSSETDYSLAFTDKKKAMDRVSLIAKPKVDWIRHVFKNYYNAYPTKMLDVGAGGGHFVKAAQDTGMQCVGIEISKNDIHFAKESMGIELVGKDFINDPMPYSGAEIISFIGVLEHVPEPMRFVETAKQILNKNRSGRRMIVIEVPRWECVGTFVQRIFSNSICRHLVPHLHISVFTDPSIRYVADSLGLDIVAKWYFGMDAYEGIVQLSRLFKSNTFLNTAKHLNRPLQRAIDHGRLSDEIMIVCTF